MVIQKSHGVDKKIKYHSQNGKGQFPTPHYMQHPPQLSIRGRDTSNRPEIEWISTIMAQKPQSTIT